LEGCRQPTTALRSSQDALAMTIARDLSVEHQNPGAHST
jgi:hypothetical protein